MVRLTASTSKSIFMIRSPQALLLLRLFRDCSPAPSLCHHLEPLVSFFLSVTLFNNSTLLLTFCEGCAGRSLFLSTRAPPSTISPPKILFSGLLCRFPEGFRIRTCPTCNRPSWFVDHVPQSARNYPLLYSSESQPIFQNPNCHSRLWYPSLNLIILCLNSKNLYHLMRYGCRNFHHEHTFIPVIIKGILQQKILT